MDLTLTLYSTFGSILRFSVLEFAGLGHRDMEKVGEGGRDRDLNVGVSRSFFNFSRINLTIVRVDVNRFLLAGFDRVLVRFGHCVERT